MSEFTPSGGKARMTKSQVRRYIAQMQNKREIAQLEIERAKLSGEFDNEEDLSDIEKKLDDVY